MTSEVIHNFIQNLRHLDDNIYRNFYQNRFLSEFTTKKKAKIPESHIFTVFLLDICRRTYFLNKKGFLI